MNESPDYALINPGIRQTVRLLRSHGFETVDSGDGFTHDYGCDRDRPYVSIVSRDLVNDANRLWRVLAAEGVIVHPISEDRGAIFIQATYDPANEIGIIELVGMTDDDL